MPLTVPADLGTDTRVLLIPHHANDYARVGVVAEVSAAQKRRGRAMLTLTALHRGIPGMAREDANGVLRVDAQPDSRR
jgi:hypothetical protein